MELLPEPDIGDAQSCLSALLVWQLATAKTYVTQILEKLEVSDRTAAAAKAICEGTLNA